MARIFISHSSANNAEALALRDWLVARGWDDLFLDIDPHRGLVSGQRWLERLQASAQRCKAVLFVLSSCAPACCPGSPATTAASCLCPSSAAPSCSSASLTYGRSLPEVCPRTPSRPPSSEELFTTVRGGRPGGTGVAEASLFLTRLGVRVRLAGLRKRGILGVLAA